MAAGRLAEKAGVQGSSHSGFKTLTLVGTCVPERARTGAQSFTWFGTECDATAEPSPACGGGRIVMRALQVGGHHHDHGTNESSA